MLAVPDSAAAERAEQMPADSRISTEYPNITRRAFEKLGIPVRVFLSYGLAETYSTVCCNEVSVAGADLAQLGGLLQDQGGDALASEAEGGHAVAAARTTAAWRSLERVRFELLPTSGVDAQVRYLPDGATVTVTSPVLMGTRTQTTEATGTATSCCGPTAG